MASTIPDHITSYFQSEEFQKHFEALRKAHPPATAATHHDEEVYFNAYIQHILNPVMQVLGKAHEAFQFNYTHQMPKKYLDQLVQLQILPVYEGFENFEHTQMKVKGHQVEFAYLTMSTNWKTHAYDEIMHRPVEHLGKLTEFEGILVAAQLGRKLNGHARLEHDVAEANLGNLGVWWQEIFNNTDHSHLVHFDDPAFEKLYKVTCRPGEEEAVRAFLDNHLRGALASMGRLNGDPQLIYTGDHLFMIVEDQNLFFKPVAEVEEIYYQFTQYYGFLEFVHRVMNAALV